MAKSPRAPAEKAAKPAKTRTPGPRAMAESATPPSRTEVAVAPDSAAPAAAAEPVVIAAAAPAEATGPQLKVKELLERVCARAGTRRKEAKDIVEATLAVLGEALANGEALNLTGLGKARVSRQKDTRGGELLVVKIRRGDKPEKPAGSKKAAKEALADPED